MARVAVAMSGGVDSSTAAALLAEAGHEVVGLTLRLWDYSAENLASGRGRCCSPADIADARVVSDRLDMPHYVFDHSKGFRAHVIDPFIADYVAGQTPSPCIRCNRLVKFELLSKLARGLDAEYLATGHYARLDTEVGNGGRPQLRKGHDRDKDQSYFLFDVPAELFGSVVFPLGEMAKNEVRDAARRLGVPVADKPESYELCFIPDGDKNKFIEGELPTVSNTAGPIRHINGTVLGSHRGLHRYTIGQRRGLGLHHPQALFVIDLQPEGNTLLVGPEEALESDRLIAGRCNWVSIERPSEPFEASTRIRHRHQAVPALIKPQDDGRMIVEFEAPQRAITPGQGVAFYRDDLLLGGGWIER